PRKVTVLGESLRRRAGNWPIGRSNGCRIICIRSAAAWHQHSWQEMRLRWFHVTSLGKFLENQLGRDARCSTVADFSFELGEFADQSFAALAVVHPADDVRSDLRGFIFV